MHFFTSNIYSFVNFKKLQEILYKKNIGMRSYRETIFLGKYINFSFFTAFNGET